MINQLQHHHHQQQHSQEAASRALSQRDVMRHVTQFMDHLSISLNNILTTLQSTPGLRKSMILVMPSRLHRLCIYISLGSVATQLRCGGIFKILFIIQ